MKVIITLPDVSKEESTSLTSAVSAAATSLSVRNNNGLSANDYVIVGKIGTETAEIRKIASVSGSGTVTVDALKFSHPTSAPVVKTRYNQGKIYGLATSGGSETSLATLDLQVDIPDGTSYDDTSGLYSFYKISYYNSTTTNESDKSGEIPADGFPPNSLHELIADVYDLIVDKEQKYVSRDTIVRKLNAAQTAWWFAPYTKRDLKTDAVLDTVADQNYIDLPANFDKLDGDFSVSYENDDDDTVDELGFMEIVTPAELHDEYADLTADSSDDLKKVAVMGTKLLVAPTPATSGKHITITYYQKPTKLVNDGDETLCPVPRIITLPVAFEIELNRDTTKAAALQAMLNQLLPGDIEHGRTKSGSYKIRYVKKYGRNRYR